MAFEVGHRRQRRGATPGERVRLDQVGLPVDDVGFADAASRAMAKAEPGTPEFRVALRDAIFSTKEVVGVHGVYSFKPGNLYGVDERARVIVKLDNGQWKLAP